jgi:hypothetical protein
VGVNAIGHWTKLFSLPVYGIIIFALNFWPLYRAYERENKFLMHFLGISTAALQLILLLATILIVNL